MPKIKKAHRGHKYQYGKDRKRLNNKVNSTGQIKNPVIKKAWEENKTLKQNVREMGLSIDPNISLGLPSIKQKRIKYAKIVNGIIEEEDDIVPSAQEHITKPGVVETLEKDAKEFRPSKLRLPKSQIQMLTYYLDKFGFDYAAMVRDKRNYDQETWKQLRAKVRKFMSISEQWNEYVLAKEKKGEAVTVGTGKWIENESDEEL